jgi:hypothetical protein
VVDVGQGVDAKLSRPRELPVGATEVVLQWRKRRWRCRMSCVGEALTALAAAAVVLRARVVPQVPPWTVIGQITRGRLVAPVAPG